MNTPLEQPGPAIPDDDARLTFFESAPTATTEELVADMRNQTDVLIYVTNDAATRDALASVANLPTRKSSQGDLRMGGVVAARELARADVNFPTEYTLVVVNTNETLHSITAVNGTSWSRQKMSVALTRLDEMLREARRVVLADDCWNARTMDAWCSLLPALKEGHKRVASTFVRPRGSVYLRETSSGAASARFAEQTIHELPDNLSDYAVGCLIVNPSSRTAHTIARWLATTANIEAKTITKRTTTIDPREADWLNDPSAGSPTRVVSSSPLINQMQLPRQPAGTPQIHSLLLHVSPNGVSLAYQLRVLETLCDAGGFAVCNVVLKTPDDTGSQPSPIARLRTAEAAQATAQARRMATEDSFSALGAGASEVVTRYSTLVDAIRAEAKSFQRTDVERAVRRLGFEIYGKGDLACDDEQHEDYEMAYHSSQRAEVFDLLNAPDGIPEDQSDLTPKETWLLAQAIEVFKAFGEGHPFKDSQDVWEDYVRHGTKAAEVFTRSILVFSKIGGDLASQIDRWETTQGPGQRLNNWVGQRLILLELIRSLGVTLEELFDPSVSVIRTKKQVLQTDFFRTQLEHRGEATTLCGLWTVTDKQQVMKVANQLMRCIGIRVIRTRVSRYGERNYLYEYEGTSGLKTVVDAQYGGLRRLDGVMDDAPVTTDTPLFKANTIVPQQENDFTRRREACDPHNIVDGESSLEPRIIYDEPEPWWFMSLRNPEDDERHAYWGTAEVTQMKLDGTYEEIEPFQLT